MMTMDFRFKELQKEELDYNELSITIKQLQKEKIKQKKYATK
jgi:AMMECR1 domain-containing protein